MVLQLHAKQEINSRYVFGFGVLEFLFVPWLCFLLVIFVCGGFVCFVVLTECTQWLSSIYMTVNQFPF